MALGPTHGHRPDPADVGRRVSLRVVSQAAGGPHSGTDVVGRLLLWTKGELWVRRNDARVVCVAEAEVVAGVVVPEHPRSSHVREPVPSAEHLAWVADAGWPAAERHQVGTWALRAHGGVTRRANSVLAPGPLPPQIDAVLAEAARWYDLRGLPLLVQTPGGGPVDVMLVGRGWERGEATLFQTASTAAVLDILPSPRQSLRAHRSAEPDPTWYAVDGDPDPRRRAILTGPAQVVFVTVYGPDGAAWGVGRASSVKGWAGLTSVTTLPAARRQGVAGEVVRELLCWASETSSADVYLQVRTANLPGRALYAGMGFSTHHTYGYLAPPPR